MNDLGCRMNCVRQTKYKQIVTKQILAVRRDAGLLLERHSILLLLVPLKSETKSNSAMNTTVGAGSRLGLEKKGSLCTID
jgi:hypothetical protein